MSRRVGEKKGEEELLIIYIKGRKEESRSVV